MGAEGWTLHPRLDQEEEAREGKVCSDAKKTISEGASCLAQPRSWSVEQWEWCVRTMAAVMETWARQSGVEIIVENKEGMNILERPLAPPCRTDGPRHHCLGNSHWSVQYSCLWGLPAVELSQDTGTAGLRVPPGLALGRRLGSAWQGTEVLLS